MKENEYVGNDRWNTHKHECSKERNAGGGCAKLSGTQQAGYHHDLYKTG